MASGIDIIDHSAEVLAAIRRAKETALEEIGLKAEGYAKKNITANKSVDTGNLRNSITHEQAGDDEYIGTNVEYAPYVELGTGIHATGGSGAKKIPWSYQDEKGQWHRTSGRPAKPFLKPAASEHADEYKRIIERHLKNLK